MATGGIQRSAPVPVRKTVRVAQTWPTPASRRNWTVFRGVALFGLVVVALLLSGCGEGPLVSIESGGHAAASVSGMSIHPGQIADIGVSVVNTGSEPVTVTAVALIAVPGLPRPRLLHSGLGHAKVGGGERNWPPTGVGDLSPLVGATIPPGRSWLWMGITGTKPDTTYAAAGMRLTYIFHGETHRVAAFGGGTACVLAGRLRSCPDRLTQPVSRRVLDYIESQ